MDSNYEKNKEKTSVEKPDEAAASSPGTNDTFCIKKLKQITEESRGEYLLALEGLKNKIIKRNQFIDQYIREDEAMGGNVTWMKNAISLFKGEVEQLNTIYLEKSKNPKKQLRNDQIRIARLEKIEQILKKVETTTPQEIEESSLVILRKRDNQKQATGLEITRLEALNQMKEENLEELKECQDTLAKLTLKEEKILVDESIFLKIQHDTSQVVASQAPFYKKEISENEKKQKELEYKLKHIGKMDTNLYASILQKDLDERKEKVSNSESELEKLKSRALEYPLIQEELNKKENITKLKIEQVKSIELLTDKLKIIDEVIKMEIEKSPSHAIVASSRNLQTPRKEMTRAERIRQIVGGEKFANVYAENAVKNQKNANETSDSASRELFSKVADNNAKNYFATLKDIHRLDGVSGISIGDRSAICGISSLDRAYDTLPVGSSPTTQATKKDSNAQVSEISLNAQNEESNLRRTGAIKKQKKQPPMRQGKESVAAKEVVLERDTVTQEIETPKTAPGIKFFLQQVANNEVTYISEKDYEQIYFTLQGRDTLNEMLIEDPEVNIKLNQALVAGIKLTQEERDALKAKEVLLEKKLELKKEEEKEKKLQEERDALKAKEALLEKNLELKKEEEKEKKLQEERDALKAKEALLEKQKRETEKAKLFELQEEEKKKKEEDKSKEKVRSIVSYSR